MGTRRSHHRRLSFFIDNLLGPGHDVLLEPLHISRRAPFDNDVKSIEDGPNPIERIGRPKVVWPCHYLQSKILAGVIHSP